MASSRALFLLPLLFILSGCNDSSDTINIVNSDCGLIRSDLLGVYTVSFAPVTADLFNCSDPLFDGKTVTVVSAPRDFPTVQVFASAFNTGFAFTDGTGAQAIFGNAETDSCGMGFSVLDNEGVYLNCFGTLDRATGQVFAACDSAAVPEFPLTNPPNILADCDLDPILQVNLTIH